MQYTYQNKGFGLVEILVVLSILGISLALTLNHYFDYKVRSGATEMIHLSADAKAKISEFILIHKAYPQTMQEAGVKNVNSKFLKNLSVNHSGTIILTSDEQALGAPIQLLLKPTFHGDAVTWKCTGLGKPGYLPSSCR